MHSPHVKSTIRYYIILVFALVFLFFSGDFGLIDVQKTAIVMAVGIDREEDAFIVTSQIAIPQASKQGKATETVQLVSRGKTVAKAFEEINAKTGWYPKLVFCRLIVLGEKTVQNDVFDALDFFLLDEYMSDNCLVATCEGTAKDLLNVKALVDPSGSVAMQKVLAPHAERVGAVLPSTLREFAIGYYSDSKSSYLPILKTQPQQEQIGNEPNQQTASSGGQEGQNGAKNQEQGQNESKDKPVFSASETALFYAGRQVDKLSANETFAVSASLYDLKLASYSVEDEQGVCTLSIKNNTRKSKLHIEKSDRPTLKVAVTLTAGLLDYSKALPLEKVKDAGDVPVKTFSQAEKLLSSQITSAFEKCRLCGCDLFGIQEKIQKYNQKHYERLKNTALQNAVLDVSVVIKGVR